MRGAEDMLAYFDVCNFASLVSDHINQLLRMLSRISLTFYFENGVSHVYIRSCKLLSINKINGTSMYF